MAGRSRSRARPCSDEVAKYRKYRDGGIHTLAASPVPGRPPKLSGAQLARIYALGVGNDPRQL